MTHDQDPLQRAIAFKANTRHSCLAPDRSTASTKQAAGGAGARSHDAVVMIENIMRHIEAGEPPLKAALTGLLLQGAASPAGLLQCINLRSGESATGHGLPWRPSAGAAGPPQKAAAPAGYRGFRVGP